MIAQITPPPILTAGCPRWFGDLRDPIIVQFGALTNRLALAASGESLISRRLSTDREDESPAVMERVKRADVAFTHLETAVHDRVGYPVAQCR